MAKIQKLKTRKPTPEEIKNWQKFDFDPEALFLLFLIETWHQNWQKKWTVPNFMSAGFDWQLSEQGFWFWAQRCFKTRQGLRKYRP